MTLKTVHIDIQQGTEPVFRFEAAEGPVRTITVSVEEEATGQVMWWLVSNAFASRELVPVESYAEDFNPESLPRTPEEYEAVIAGEPSNRVLEVLRYGEVPVGFFQAQPRTGSASVLRAGLKYRVTLVGEFSGQASFMG